MRGNPATPESPAVSESARGDVCRGPRESRNAYIRVAWRRFSCNHLASSGREQEHIVYREHLVSMLTRSAAAAKAAAAAASSSTQDTMSFSQLSCGQSTDRDSPVLGGSIFASVEQPPAKRARKEGPRPVAGPNQQQSRLLQLPSDVLAHIIELLPTVESVARAAFICRAFPFPTHEGGRSIIEEAMRGRAVAQTGAELPTTVPLGEKNGSWTRQLFLLERCRRGLVLRPQASEPGRKGERPGGQRRPVYIVRPCGRMSVPCSVLLGRTTRVVDNGQGIQDPRVSRRHAEISLRSSTAHDDSGRWYTPAEDAWSIGFAKIDAVGHNPSRIVRRRHDGRTNEKKLRRADQQQLRPGDELHLVCEDVSRAHGRSAAFEGNTCMYKVDMIKASEIEHIVKTRHEDAQAAGADAAAVAVAEAERAGASPAAAAAAGAVRRQKETHLAAAKLEEFDVWNAPPVEAHSGVLYSPEGGKWDPVD